MLNLNTSRSFNLAWNQKLNLIKRGSNFKMLSSFPTCTVLFEDMVESTVVRLGAKSWRVFPRPLLVSEEHISNISSELHPYQLPAAQKVYIDQHMTYMHGPKEAFLLAYATVARAWVVQIEPFIITRKRDFYNLNLPVSRTAPDRRLRAGKAYDYVLGHMVDDDGESLLGQVTPARISEHLLGGRLTLVRLVNWENNWKVGYDVL